MTPPRLQKQLGRSQEQGPSPGTSGDRANRLGGGPAVALCDSTQWDRRACPAHEPSSLLRKEEKDPEGIQKLLPPPHARRARTVLLSF